MVGAAAAAIHYLGFTPGLLIVGFYGILIMWMYGYVWITTMLLIVGGYMFSLNHARFLILMATAYAVYCVNAHVGLHGVLLSLNISFISNDILNNFLQGFDGNGKGIHVKEQKEPEQVIEDFPFDSENSPLTKETEDMTYSKSSCTTPKASKLSNTQKDASSSKVNIVDLTSLVEIERIMNSSNHYEVLGFLRNKNVDPNILKKEYHKKVLLVHPDKNMGNSVACESFKKLQCAYEFLTNKQKKKKKSSDFTKKKNYDEQLRKEESGRVCHRSSVMSQQVGILAQEMVFKVKTVQMLLPVFRQKNIVKEELLFWGGVEYRSEESRCIECTKCGNSHIWICTNRSKAKARWCQDCSQYHQAKDGDGWVESGCSPVVMPPRKVEIPRAFVCAESKIFDVSEWAICQGMACRPDTHGPTFHVNMVGLDTTGLRSNSSRYPWGLDAEMIDEDELWLQQPLASGIFSETQKRRKGWPFKINQKSMRPWRKLP
ncbi:heat shock protein DnaJ [Musa troglodytarum]|uniref:Heat shock protein DnaJ n=1 Tax=Musa troglodytarum TaxID=320322 RepID=A0A9E7I508_9LILI|nr:heat shock protein DnaJ [Musa troglodytarum]